MGHLQRLAVHPRELRMRVLRGLRVARRRVLDEAIVGRLADRLDQAEWALSFERSNIYFVYRRGESWHLEYLEGGAEDAIRLVRFALVAHERDLLVLQLQLDHVLVLVADEYEIDQEVRLPAGGGRDKTVLDT